MQNRRIIVRVGRKHPSHNYNVHINGKKDSREKLVKNISRKYVITSNRKKVKNIKINRGAGERQYRYPRKVYSKKNKAIKINSVRVSSGRRTKKIGIRQERISNRKIKQYRKIKSVIRMNARKKASRVVFCPVKKENLQERTKYREKSIEQQVEKKKKRQNRGFIKDAAFSVARGEMEAQQGGTELLESVETLQTVWGGGKSFVKTTVETVGKVYYAKEKDEKVDRKLWATSVRSNKLKRKIRHEKKLKGVQSREEYIEKRNVLRKQRASRKKEENNKRNEQIKERMVRKRMLTYMKNKISGDPEKNDSVGMVVRDIAKGKVKQLGKRLLSAVGKKLLYYLGLALGAVLSNVVVMMPVIIIVVFLYSSPLAIFLSNKDQDASIQDILTEYYTEFSDKVQKEEEKDGYDRIQIKSSNGETDVEVSKSNYKDVLCVFAEKYGYNLQIADVSSKVKKKLKLVFDDMNYYSTREITEKPNKKSEEEKTLVITLTQKTWREMIDVYRFDDESQKEIKELLSLADDPEMGIEVPEDEDYGSYAGTDTCIDGKIYDNPNAPVYKGACAKIAKKTKRYIRPILRKKGMEPYIDIIVSMVQQESCFGRGDNANWLQVNGYKGPSGMASVKAGIEHFSGILKICKQNQIKDIKVLIQSYNMGQGYISYVKKRGGKDSISLQIKFQFLQRSDGRYGTAGYSNDVMSRVKGQKPKVKNMPLYYQWDSKWNTVAYGSSTIGRGGCGICSSAMVASYWTGKQITPPELVKWAYIYHTPQGSSHALYAAVAKKYNLKYRDLGLSKSEMVKELKKGHTVIASMGPGEFTRNSHLIVLRTIENGKIRVNDPNDNSSKNHVNKGYTPAAIHKEAKHYWSLYK